MKVKILFLILLLLTTFNLFPAQNVFGVTPTPTIEYALPYPGILPDNPLYPLKVMRDKILLFFTRDPVRKAQLNLLMADKRLVMGQFLWEKGKSDLSINTITKGEKYLLLSSLGLWELKKQNNLPPGLSDKIDLAGKKHEEVITKLITSTSDENYRKRLNDALGITHQARQQIAPDS